MDKTFRSFVLKNQSGQYLCSSGPTESFMMALKFPTRESAQKYEKDDFKVTEVFISR